MMVGHWRLDANSDQASNVFSEIKLIPENIPMDMERNNRAYTLRTLSRFHLANELTEIRMVCTKPSHGRMIDLIIKNEEYFSR